MNRIKKPMGLREILSRSEFVRNLAFYFKSKKRTRKNAIKGSNNKIVNRGRFYKVNKKIFGDNNYVEVDELSALSDVNIMIRGNNNRITIGKSTNINGTLWIEGSNCHITIGNRVTVINASFTVTEDNLAITVGDSCLFSYGIEVRTSDSHSIIDLASKERINRGESIEIGNHVWVGVKTMLLKGVKIGDDSVIGAQSLVTKDVPANSIAAGNPAKVVKSDITWDINQI
ncbi:acyltransferase [Viscerimonas tarda]